MRIISGAVFYLGYLWMLWDKEKQCWQDKVAERRRRPGGRVPVPPLAPGRGVGPSDKLTNRPFLAPMEPITCPQVVPAHSNRSAVSIACA